MRNFVSVVILINVISFWTVLGTCCETQNPESSVTAAYQEYNICMRWLEVAPKVISLSTIELCLTYRSPTLYFLYIFFQERSFIDLYDTRPSSYLDSAIFLLHSQYETFRRQQLRDILSVADLNTLSVDDDLVFADQLSLKMRVLMEKLFTDLLPQLSLIYHLDNQVLGSKFNRIRHVFVGSSQIKSRVFMEFVEIPCILSLDEMSRHLSLIIVKQYFLDCLDQKTPYYVNLSRIIQEFPYLDLPLIYYPAAANFAFKLRQCTDQFVSDNLGKRVVLFLTKAQALYDFYKVYESFYLLDLPTPYRIATSRIIQIIGLVNPKMEIVWLFKQGPLQNVHHMNDSNPVLLVFEDIKYSLVKLLVDCDLYYDLIFSQFEKLLVWKNTEMAMLGSLVDAKQVLPDLIPLYCDYLSYMSRMFPALWMLKKDLIFEMTHALSQILMHAPASHSASYEHLNHRISPGVYDQLVREVFFLCIRLRSKFWLDDHASSFANNASSLLANDASDEIGLAFVFLILLKPMCTDLSSKINVNESLILAYNSIGCNRIITLETIFKTIFT